MPDTARTLVGKLVAAGEWPEPGLLQAILDQGDAAVEPLLEVVRGHAHGPPGEAPLSLAVCLLGSLGAAAAVPDLVELLPRYDNETLQDVSRTLGLLGTPAVEPALAALRQPGLTPSQRAAASDAAVLAAGNDPELRARVAATIRELLADHVARAAELGSEDRKMVTVFVSSLTNLADPQARALIDQAFRAGLVDTQVLRPKDVDDFYREGPEEVPRPDPRAWLEEYQDLYEEEMEARKEQAEAEGKPPPPPAG
jgi:hypothetical protein